MCWKQPRSGVRMPSVGQLFTLGAYAISAAAQLPLAILGGPTFLFPTSASNGKGPLRTEREESRPQERWRHREFVQNLNQALGFAKVSPVQAWLDTPAQGDLFLLRSIPELEPRCAAHSRVRHVGPCLEPWHEAHRGFESWLARPSDRKGLIYVQLGRTFDEPSFLAALLSASEKLPFRLVIDLLRSNQRPPEGLEHVFPCSGISMHSVLPHVSCVITNGHGSAALGAAARGLPLLLLPCGSGSEELAWQFTRAGIALSVPNREATASNLVELLTRLHETPSFRERAQLIGAAVDRFQGDSPYARAADELEGDDWRRRASWWRAPAASTREVARISA
jgi:UDP:flavonoid glycosyltransferase YjiC (YdhE family)